MKKEEEEEEKEVDKVNNEEAEEEEEKEGEEDGMRRGCRGERESVPILGALGVLLMSMIGEEEAGRVFVESKVDPIL